jgi:hypothetical protein
MLLTTFFVSSILWRLAGGRISLQPQCQLPFHRHGPVPNNPLSRWATAAGFHDAASSLAFAHLCRVISCGIVS